MTNNKNHSVLTDTEFEECEEKITAIFNTVLSLESGCARLLTSLCDLKKSDVNQKLQFKFDEEDLSKNLDSSLSFCYPWIRGLIHDFSSVVDAAINVREIPTLGNFATLSALSYVPKQSQIRIFKLVMGYYPNNERDVERANEIIQSVNVARGAGDILKEYDLPRDRSEYKAKLNRKQRQSVKYRKN